MDLTDLVVEANRLSGLLDKGITALREASVRHAQADHAYRKARAIAYLQATGTVAERDAHADVETAEGRLDRDLAAGEAEAARQAVRAPRTQLSAVLSPLHGHPVEDDFSHVWPRSRR